MNSATNEFKGYWVTHVGKYCEVCDFVIFSMYRHDYKHCKCGLVMVDGGFDYFRCSIVGKDVKMRVYRYGVEPEKSDNKATKKGVAVVPSKKRSKEVKTGQKERTVQMRQLPKVRAKARSARRPHSAGGR